jgi:hypothetical protein
MALDFDYLLGERFKIPSSLKKQFNFYAFSFIFDARVNTRKN